MLLLASFIASALIAQEAQVTPLMSKDLADFPGKEGLMITVVYPPSRCAPRPQHDKAGTVNCLLDGSQFIPASRCEILAPIGAGGLIGAIQAMPKREHINLP
jgi:hypothetical protein